MIAPEMPSETRTILTSAIDIVPVQEAFSLFTRRSPKTDHPRIQAKGYEFIQNCLRDRNRARLVIFHRRHFTLWRFFRVRTRDSQPAQVEVNIGPSQRCYLPPTKSAVSGNHYQDAVPFGIELSCELPEFGVGERL